MESTSTSATIVAAVAHLRDRGERVTRARLAVLSILDQTVEHLSAEEIVDRSIAESATIHRSTIYRALSTLGELRLVTHTRLGNGVTVHQLASRSVEDQHAHAQCSRCGQIIDVPVEQLRQLARALDRDLQFELALAEVALTGLCGACRAISDA